MNFLPLHVYTGYTFLGSGLSLPALVSLTKKAVRTHCCVSDLGSMTGFPELKELCSHNDIQPIYAMDISLDGYVLTLVVKSEAGYRNLIKICYLYDKKELGFAEFNGLKQGLGILLDLSSPALKEAYYSRAFGEAIKALRDKIGDFALGLPYLPSEPDFIASCREYADQYSYELLASPFIKYAKSGDAIALSIVEAIANDAKLEQKKLDGDQWYLDDETLALFYTDEEIAAPMAFIEDVDFELNRKRGQIPHFPTPEGMSSREYLFQLARDGLKKRGLNEEKYAARLEKELNIIDLMGYSDYFLIVADYVNYAKTHGILVGPGRGSGAGSLVSYALHIVEVDPLKYGLLFERFLNPERQSMPDIDVDFQDDRREEVVHYLQLKYGRSRVAHIVTMQTLGAKASIRDIGRIYDYEQRHIDTLCKSLGQFNGTLKGAYKQVESFHSLVDSDPFYREIISLASKIEGLPRQSGLHAAGIVISEEGLEEVVPVKETEIGYVAQYEMVSLEDQGCLKMDLLGLRNLTMVKDCLRLIEKTKGLQLDPYEIPYDDPKAIRCIASGKTMGLFQLESTGMRQAIMEVTPTSFEEVAAILALYRPGPMANIPVFAARKKGKEKITYLSPLLEPILKETYGIMVYQEQIMEIAISLAGYTYGKADSFRRAISKKNAAKLASLKEEFILGCRQNGVDGNTAEEIFSLIERFADYGFNKSHAVAYAKLTCQMAYLKSHHALSFYSAILDSTSVTDPKFIPTINELRQIGAKVLPPSINRSQYGFYPEQKAVRFPLGAIRGFSGVLGARLIQERELHGPYADIFDLASRNKEAGLNLQALIRLIDAGALDEFPHNRASLRLAAPRAIDYAAMFDFAPGQITLGLSFPKPEIPSVEGDLESDLLAEKEALGMMISGSPLNGKEELIRSKGACKLSELSSKKGYFVVAGVVDYVKAITSKRGHKMAFLSLYDEECNVEFTLFADTYDKCFSFLKEGAIVLVKGRRNAERDSYVALEIERI